MNYLENNSIKDFVKDIITDRLFDYEDTKTYGCDMAYTLLEQYNIDGSYFYSTYESEEFIKQHFSELGEIVEEISFQLGKEFIPNIFDEPEKFTVVIFLEVANYILSQCKTIDDNWNNEMTLNKKTINQIIKEMKDV